MYRTSSAYKQEMLQHQRLESYVWVYLGMVNQEAQKIASISSELAPFAQRDVFETSKFTGYYTSAEQNLCKVDGSRYFMPKNTNYYNVFNQGAVSKDILGSITFVFPVTIENIGGLTIDFGEEYPTEYTVTNGTQTFTYTNDKAGLKITTDGFDNSDYLTITPVTMVGGQQRLRIHSILFGIGFQFTNKELISTKRLNKISHLSTELPQKTFEFTIDNYSQDWTMDNPRSYSDALEEKQIVQVTYGRKLPDGEVYEIPSAYMALQSWSSNHSSATFKAVGFLDYSTTTYYQGKLGRKTLYQLAEEVLADMGIENYKLDPFLRRLYTDNPIPIDTHKACLQQIANAGCCAMYEDYTGTLTIQSSIGMPEYVYTVENTEAYSNSDNLMNGATVYNFASAEKDYSIVDGTMNFFKSLSSPQETGVVSYMYPTNKDLKITIEFEAICTFVGLTLRFGSIYPSKVITAEYKDGSLVETNEFDIDSLVYFVNHEFHEIDKIVVTFDGVTDNTRIHLNKLILGAVTDYEIMERDLEQLPTAKQTTRIKSVNVKYYEFVESDKVSTATVNAEVGDNLATFNKPCYDYAIEGCTIKDSGAYYVIFTASEEGKVKITSKEYQKLESTYTVPLRRTGNELTLENDLISSEDLARRVANWFAEYYRGEVEYEFSYRGEPALECGDRIFLENRFVNNNLILVESEELSTSIGMSMNNGIKARQLSYDLDTT